MRVNVGIVESLMILNIGDVIYNALYPLAAPDIIFGPEDESFRPYHVGGGDGDLKSPRKSLSDWNCKDPTWLLSLILELRLDVLPYLIHFSFFSLFYWIYCFGLLG